MAIKPFHITLIGAGNVAYHLARQLVAAPVVIDCVYSRTEIHAREVASFSGAKSTTNISNIPSGSDFYLIALTDLAVEEFAAQFKTKHGIVVHTSGSHDLNILAGTSKQHGVVYPLQTFSRSKTVDFSKIPICTEANDDLTLIAIDQLASLFSNDVRHLNSEQRRITHLAAVFACNFSNFMYVAAADILKQHGLQFEILLPLIGEFFAKLNMMNPWEAQTGPAIRGDRNVIEKHIELLRDTDGYDHLYELISNLIENKKIIKTSLL